MRTDEALQEGLVALREWLIFLERTKTDLGRQLDRVRNAGGGDGGEKSYSEDPFFVGEDKPDTDDWIL